MSGSLSAAIGFALSIKSKSLIVDVAVRDSLSSPPLSRHQEEIAVFQTSRPRILIAFPSHVSAIDKSSSLGITQSGEPAEPVSSHVPLSMDSMPATSTVLPDWYIHVDWDDQSSKGISIG